MAEKKLLPVQYQRQYADSIDPDYRFADKAARIAYLSSARCYAGQPIYDKAEGKVYIVNENEDGFKPAGGDGKSLVITYTKEGHAYTNADLNKPFNWYLEPAQGNSANNAEFLGFLIGLPDPDTLELITFGNIDITGWGLVVGKTYYLSTLSPGELIVQEDADLLESGVLKPVLNVITETSGEVLKMPGMEIEYGAGGESNTNGKSLITTYHKDGHAFTDVHLNKPFNWYLVPAQGDTSNNSEFLGFLINIPDVDHLKLVTSGFIDISGWGLIAGKTYYLSTTTPGELIVEEDAELLVSGVLKPVLNTVSNKVGEVLKMRGVEIGDAGNGGGIQSITGDFINNDNPQNPTVQFTPKRAIAYYDSEANTLVHDAANKGYYNEQSSNFSYREGTVISVINQPFGSIGLLNFFNNSASDINVFLKHNNTNIPFTFKSGAQYSFYVHSPEDVHTYWSLLNVNDRIVGSEPTGTIKWSTLDNNTISLDSSKYVNPFVKYIDNNTNFITISPDDSIGPFYNTHLLVINNSNTNTYEITFNDKYDLINTGGYLKDTVHIGPGDIWTFKFLYTPNGNYHLHIDGFLSFSENPPMEEVGMGSNLVSIYPKTGHTYVVGDINKYFNYSLSPALADTTENAKGLGFLKSINGDKLEFITKGDIDITGWLDASGGVLVVGTTYYLSNTVAGGLVTEAEAKGYTEGVLLPVLHVIAATSGQILGDVGYKINTGGNERTILSKTSNTITFTQSAIHGSKTTPLTGDFTLDFTGAKFGYAVKAYHGTTKPTFTSSISLSEIGDYIEGENHIVFIQYEPDNITVHYQTIGTPTNNSFTYTFPFNLA